MVLVKYSWSFPMCVFIDNLEFSKTASILQCRIIIIIIDVIAVCNFLLAAQDTHYEMLTYSASCY